MTTQDEAAGNTAASLYDLAIHRLDGTPLSLSEYRGKVLLLVNTASACGFTPQYAGLQRLYDTHRDRGLVVIGFPCNQFGAQEPGDAEQIATFCERNYGVSFPLTEKIDVNGANAHPIFQYLTAKAPGVLGTEAIKWNFTKFLVNRDGQVIDRFAPATSPEKIESAIETLLA